MKIKIIVKEFLMLQKIGTSVSELELAMTKVSIIIPTYNNQTTIVRTLDSILKQSFKGLEILVVDNGSLDDTKTIVQNYVKKDSRIVLLNSERGRSRARNYGLKKATGDYIQFLDSDDELAPDKIATAVSFLEAHSNYFAYICSSITVYDNKDKEPRYAPVEYAYRDGPLGYNPYRINSVLFRNSTNLILFDQSLSFCEDWLFWVENLVDKKVFLDKSHFDAIVHVTGDNTSNNMKKVSFYIIYTRCLIKKRIKKRTLRLFIRDIRLASIYILLNLKEFELPEQKLISKKMRLELLIVHCLMLFPPFKKKFWYREKLDLDNSDYLD